MTTKLLEKLAKMKFASAFDMPADEAIKTVTALEICVKALENSAWHHDTQNDYCHVFGHRICDEAIASVANILGVVL